jgi:hypothetical protein
MGLFNLFHYGQILRPEREDLNDFSTSFYFVSASYSILLLKLVLILKLSIYFAFAISSVLGSPNCRWKRSTQCSPSSCTALLID